MPDKPFALVQEIVPPYRWGQAIKAVNVDYFDYRAQCVLDHCAWVVKWAGDPLEHLVVPANVTVIREG